MAHLLSAEAQEEVTEAGETEHSGAEEIEETLTPLSEPVSPPEGTHEPSYRLGQMEARLAQLETALTASLQVTQEQAQELAATEEQLEIQEEALSSAQEDDQEECQQEHPPLWCRLLGGQRKH